MSDSKRCHKHTHKHYTWGQGQCYNVIDLVKLTSPELKNPSLKVKENNQIVDWSIIMRCINKHYSKWISDSTLSPLPPPQKQWLNKKKIHSVKYLQKSLWCLISVEFLLAWTIQNKAKLAIRDTKTAVELCHLTTSHFTQQHSDSETIRNWLKWLVTCQVPCHPQVFWIKQRRNKILLSLTEPNRMGIDLNNNDLCTLIMAI